MTWAYASRMGAFSQTGRFLARQTVRAARAALRLLAGPSISHGSAAWAGRSRLRRAGILGDDGLIVGKLGKKLVRFPGDEGHVLVFAPSGAGKGVGLVIPNLLSYPGSVICTDIKGENFAITARQRAAFGPVYRLDVSAAAGSHRFNPLDMIRVGTGDESDDAEMLAGLIVADETAQDSHWQVKARDWLSGFILYVVHAYAERAALCTLTEVHRLASSGPAALDDLLTRMAASGVPRVQEIAFQIQMAAGSEESRNILSNIQKNTGLWSPGRPAATVCSTTTVPLSRFYDAPQSLFLIIPEEKLEFYRGFLRVMVGCALYAVYRAGRQSLSKGPKPLFMLDEAAALGYLAPLEAGMGYLRAYARTMLVFQDLGQLEALYPKARSLIANARCHVAFGVNDMPTAKMLSERLGQATVETRSAGYSQDSEALFRHRDSDGRAETGRWLLDASEITRMGRDEALIMLPGHVSAPIKAERLDYRFDRRFAGLWDGWRTPPVTGDAGHADARGSPPAPARPSQRGHSVSQARRCVAGAVLPRAGHRSSTRLPARAAVVLPALSSTAIHAGSWLRVSPQKAETANLSRHCADQDQPLRGACRAA